MTGRDFSTLTDAFAASFGGTLVTLALDHEACGLLVTVGAESVCIDATRVEARTAQTLPESLPMRKCESVTDRAWADVLTRQGVGDVGAAQRPDKI
jgi:hypothetical protein